MPGTPWAGRVIVITGSARGIGHAIAEALVERGAQPILTDVDEEAVMEAAVNLDAPGLRLDVRDEAEIERVVAHVVECYGSLDGWINNAGLARHQRIDEIAADALDLMLAVNLRGTILASKHALRAMKRQGRGDIVNIVSTAGLAGVAGQAAYCATKAGVRAFTQALIAEAAPHGVRAMAVYPAGVDTGFWDDATEQPMDRARFLDAQDVAQAVMSLLELPPHCVAHELVLRYRK
jgi:NAD(P)-dependent dehydrogenase (short-subunit alcohol dehydrogenase family)